MSGKQHKSIAVWCLCFSFIVIVGALLLGVFYFDKIGANQSARVIPGIAPTAPSALAQVAPTVPAQVQHEIPPSRALEQRAISYYVQDMVLPKKKPRDA